MPSIRVRRLVELLGLAWLLLGSLAAAQEVVIPYAPLPSLSSPRSSPAPLDPALLPAPSGLGQLVPPAPPISRTAMQPNILPPPRPDGRGPSDPAEYSALQEISIQLDPPSPERRYRMESEAAFRERLRQESRNRGNVAEIVFPSEPVLSTSKYTGRHWPGLHMVVEPNFVGFNRLYFHQINFERYAWDIGPIATVLSGAAFFKDLVLLPYHHFTDPLRVYDYNTGWCYPGDPTPFLLYPEPISSTGLIGQAALVALVLVTFP